MKKELVINGEIKELTLRDFLNLHNEMWGYILEKENENKVTGEYPFYPYTDDISYLEDGEFGERHDIRAKIKKEWLKNHKIKSIDGDIYCDCFLCEWADFDCDLCPKVWGSSVIDPYCDTRIDGDINYVTSDPRKIMMTEDEIELAIAREIE